MRSERSLIQTSGRAARNANGQVIMYADKITKSMDIAINETKRRRSIQEEYNQKHGITPMTIQKEIRDVIRATHVAEDEEEYKPAYKYKNYQRKKGKSYKRDGKRNERSGQSTEFRACSRAS